MGIGMPPAQIYGSFLKYAPFKNFKSVIELGAQDVYDPDLVKGHAEKNTGVQYELPPSSTYTAAMMYKAYGFDSYACIDALGGDNCLVFDLNNNIKANYDFAEQFDLVTNHGTTEHCFNQLNCFTNIHNLCKQGGVMYHALPCHGLVYLTHCFYTYQPPFYYNLAAANNYKVIGMYMSIGYDLIPYTLEYMQKLSLPNSTYVLLHVLLQKVVEQEFRMPYDGQYLESSFVKDQYQYQSLEEELEPELGNSDNSTIIDIPNSIDEYHALGKFFLSQGKTKEAAKCYSIILSIISSPSISSPLASLNV